MKLSFKYKLLLLILSGFFIQNTTAQVGINSSDSSPDNSAMLDVQSTNKGMLIPRMTTAQRTVISSPATGLLVFDNTTGSFWFYNGSVWEDLSANVSDKIADTDNDTKIQVEESADEDMIRFDIGGVEKWVMKGGRLEVLNNNDNIFLGEHTGESIGNGVANVAIGDQALVMNGGGDQNIAIGFASLLETTGNGNVAIGYEAMSGNENGNNNVVIGRNAFLNNISGSNNVMLGREADATTDNLIRAVAIGYRAKVATSNSLVLGGTGVNAVKVGIGTDTPTELLTLTGISGTDGILFPDNTLQTTAFSGSTVGDIITDADDDTKIQVEETADEDIIRFDTDGTQRMIINNNGFVGVGPSNPTANLTVMGTATTNVDIAHFSNSNNAKKTIISLSNSGAGQMALLDGSNNTAILLSSSANSYFNAANLGVGNNNPQEKLHITGNIRMEDGNQGLGKVMTSDANGKATWQIATGGTSDSITDTDNDTKIQVEETTDEDVIRFDVAGTEQFKMDGARLEVLNSGRSVFIGQNAGLNDDLTDNDNVFIGYESGILNTQGRLNTAVGFGAFKSNTAGLANAVFGHLALEDNKTGSHNAAFGHKALSNNTVGSSNIGIGTNAIILNTNGSHNVSIGDNSLGDINGGSNNVALGSGSLNFVNGAQNNNTAIGYEAGNNANGSNNVFLGYQAGKNQNVSNRLYIDNSNTATPLIYGEFDSDLVEINGSLEVVGNVASTSFSGDGSALTNLTGENLGNHIATQNIVLNGNWLSGDGGNEGIKVYNTGFVQIGAIGNLLHSIIKVTVNVNVPNIQGAKGEWVDIPVLNAQLGGVVSISPSSALDKKIVIGQAYVSAVGTVRVLFRNVNNVTSNNVNPPLMNYYISVIQ